MTLWLWFVIPAVIVSWHSQPAPTTASRSVGGSHGTLSRDGIGKAHGDASKYGGPTVNNPQGNQSGGAFF